MTQFHIARVLPPPKFIIELKVVVTFHNEARHPDDFDSFHFMIL